MLGIDNPETNLAATKLLQPLSDRNLVELISSGSIPDGSVSFKSLFRVLNILSLCALVLCALALFASASNARALQSQWYASSKNWSGDRAPTTEDLEPLVALEQATRTGGQFLYIGELEITATGRYVIDFGHTTLIGQFEHRLYDNDGHLISVHEGGIQSPASNPYPIRHGRPQWLETGNYTLVSNLSSPFFIRSPEPFISDELSYLQDIKIGNLITYMGLGIFFAMAFFYLCFAVTRHNVADLAYTIFILGNLVFFATALNVTPDVLGICSFGLAHWPISISNIAYIFFVRNLLQINKTGDPILFWIGRSLTALFILFAIFGLAFQHWALELNRIAVALFLAYGLSAGLTRSYQRNTLAYFYVAANICFLIPALVTLSPDGFDQPTFYSAHMGIVSVAIEVLLLGLLQAYKMNQINRERIVALDKAKRSQQAARTDSLTGAPNRHAFEEAFAKLTEQDSFTFIDLDGLKYYNDNFGHHRGDELIREFAILMIKNLPTGISFFRIAGDEFGVISSVTDAPAVADSINKTVEILKDRGFYLCGASYGQANYTEADSAQNLKRIADARMYAVKAEKKQLSVENPQ